MIDRMRRLPSLKQKLSIVFVAAVGATAVVSQVGNALGLPFWLTPVVAATFALAIVQLLAKGLTRPLRELVDATAQLAGGDHSVRVEAERSDEVGRLGHAFNAMAADLGALDDQRRAFVANASHELRTPITALQSTLENLVDGVSEPDPTTLAGLLERTDHLGRLVEQLLDLSRLEAAGDVALHLERVDLGDLGHLLAGQLADPARGVTVDVRSPVDLKVEADPIRLRQVLTNVIANAVRHSPDDDVVTVTISVNGEVRIAVRDHGPGIPDADRQRIFEPFYQGDGARRSPGTAGLGLAIARTIIEQHRGRIDVGDHDGRGALVVIRLPKADR